jgi:hypothetical protein
LNSARAFEAYIAARLGRTEEARVMVRELDTMTGLAAGALIVGPAAALLIGELEIALRLVSRPLFKDLGHTFLRLEPSLHALLDHAPFAPRRRDATLVWPLEAPMIDRARFRLFKEVKIESGIPEGTDVR